MDNEATPTLPVTALPSGARILHIGPSKTGTTALQGACWAARADLERQGVHYAGNSRHSAAPARAVAGTPAFGSDEGTPPSIRWWKLLVREMRECKATRVLYSSEFLAHAGDDVVRRIVDDVGPDTQIAITLRPLESILASQWQQAVQVGNTLTLDDWLVRRFAEAAETRKLTMWARHDHGRLVERWVAAAGRDRVTLVIADPRDHGFLFRAFEGLLGLRPGTLRAVDDLQNRSLSYPEIELIRQFNLQAADAGIGRGARNYLVLAGAAQNVKRRPPLPGAARVRLPSWAVVRARGRAEEAVRLIRSSGVHVVGDLELLVPTAPSAAETEAPDLRVDPATAAAIALGVAYGTGLRLGPNQPQGPKRPIPFVSSSELVRIMAGRLRLGILRTWRLRGRPDE